jgi:hypothetical protein
VRIWSSGNRSSRNLIELSTTPGPTVLYVKEFNTEGRPGFWGLTKNQVTRLEKAGVKWFTVLLLRSWTDGYVLSSAEVRDRIDDGSFELSGDGDFKVNEDVDLKPHQRFHGLEDLLHRIL